MTSTLPLRIVHIDTGRSLRGGQRQMLMLARGLRDHDHEQMIVCVEGSSVESRARQEGFQVFSLPPSDPGHAFGILLLRQQLRMWRPKIVHAHDGRGQTIGWLASVGLPIKRVASRRVTFLPSDGWTYRLKYGRTCHAVIAVSENIRGLSVQAGVPRERIMVIPDGIEMLRDLPSPSEKLNLRKSWRCDEDEFLIGFLGASTLEKGQDVAIEAMNLLAEQMPNARLILAGGGAADTHSVRARVLRLGPIEDLGQLMPGLDLFIMPSLAEGLGSSALWAMSYGLPVVATRVGGLPEIIVENETGWLVPPNSPQALAEAILQACGDRDRLAEFGRRARARVERFSADIMVSRTEELYRQITGGKH